MQDLYKDTSSEESINLKQLLVSYLHYWKWFLLSVFLCLALAKIYLRYSVPVFKASATLLIKDEKSGGLSSELSAFKDLDLFGGGSKNIDDEIEVLKSRALAEKTIKKGSFNIKYILEGRIKSSDAYGANLIKIQFAPKDSLFYKKDTLIGVDVISDTQFELFDGSNNSKGKFNFNQKIKSSELGEYSIVKNVLFDEIGKPIPFTKNFYRIGIYDTEKLTDTYSKNLSVLPLTKKTNVLELSISDPVAKKAEDYLNMLISIYNQEAIKDKNIISQKTSDFINDRLGIITTELDGVEKDVETFKKSKKIVDIPTEAELNLRGNQELKAEEISTKAQLQVVNMMENYLHKSGSYEILPVNIIPNENQSAAMIAEFNNLILERNRILQSSTEDNPIVVRLDDKISNLKSNIGESLKRLKSSLVLQDKEQSKFGSQMQSKIDALPKVEREFRNIFRQQQIKEELYLYLFKKREETAITLAGTAPISKIVDKGYSSDIPVSPKKQIIYLVALLLGLIIPFSILYLKFLLDTKVKDKTDVDRLHIPFLGDVPHSDSNNEIIQSDSRTSSAEAIRIVRTNLEFVLSNTSIEKAKTIFVTSTIPGEGKTFIAANLATTMAISGKRVLLIGLDIRNPKIDEYFHVPSRGVTNFLSTADTDIDNYLLKQSGYEYFDILPSGVIPPNPAELLMNIKLEKLFDELKTKYDYIVVDTAPVSLVTDTLLIAKNADAFVYVVRSNYLEKELLKIPGNLYQEKKLPNMSIVLNDTDVEKGYGYGYGYGVEIIKKPWYQKILDLNPFK
ncbi:polysaccharide biosynthesis tyrosine autokinase [Flavobacterium sp. H122]|uniref:GumC family protein n=1 Tax=Flavobacterium sp. H122 TaxID=2529860 RepID=UPI0010AA2FEA|nr:polysaccharide biosynthesis tyrosine autokinase [Flavobacterium sp. H122]